MAELTIFCESYRVSSAEVTKLAGVAKLVDAHDSKSCGAIHESSSLSSGTQLAFSTAVRYVEGTKTEYLSRGGAVWQLAWLITRRPGVQIPPPQHAHTVFKKNKTYQSKWRQKKSIPLSLQYSQSSLS